MVRAAWEQGAGGREQGAGSRGRGQGEGVTRVRGGNEGGWNECVGVMNKYEGGEEGEKERGKREEKKRE